MLCYQHFRIFISLDSMAAVQDVLYNQGFHHEINQGANTNIDWRSSCYVFNSCKDNKQRKRIDVLSLY